MSVSEGVSLKKRGERGFSASLALVSIAFAGPAGAQGGYETEKHPRLGLSFPRARHYEAIPTQPNETAVVLRFAEKKFRVEKEGRRVIPQMWIVRIDHEASQAEQRPQDLDEYLALGLDGWTRGEQLGEHEKQGWHGAEVALRNARMEQLSGWAHVWEQTGSRTFIVLGICAHTDFEQQVKIWRHTASRMKFSAPTSSAEERERRKWERYYERRNMIDAGHRIEVRLSLTDGWKAEDTQHYIVVSDTPDKPLLRRVLRDLETIRKEYVRLFPPAEPIENASTVRICKDRTQYLQYGGAPSSVGYWSALTEELVLFDATKQAKGERKDRQDTYIVLYHEAFHQYIHYSAGRLAPHSWFDEGHGDYFAGAVISKGRLIEIGTNAWRSATIQEAVGRLDHVPWEDILRYEQQDYYANPNLCYSQGWSMVYFLNTSREVQRHPLWSRILGTYFEELRSAWELEFARILAKGGEDDQEWVAAAQVRARSLAADVAFDGVDLDEIERAWIKFVKRLR